MINRKKLLISSFLVILLFSSFLQGNAGNYNDYNEKCIRNSDPYLADIQVGSYIVPGVSESISLDRIVKIGLLGDMNHVSGDHAWKGALLAAREINEGGGILINGTQYYIGLVSENTNELHGSITDGNIAAENMINNHHPYFITGGYVSIAVLSYLEVIMDNKIPFLGTGNAIETLTQKVLDDYERYKYFFRVMPINESGLFWNWVTNIIYLANHLNATYGGTVDRIAFLHEDEGSVNNMFDILKMLLPLYNLTVVEDVAFPLAATLADFETYWNQIETVETQITVMLTIHDLNQLGVLMAQQYQAVKPRCLLFSAANILAQTSPYWDDTKGACQFEVVYQAIHNTSKTSLTIPYFNRFFKEHGVEPFYTGTGSYEAVNLVAYAVNDSQSFDSDIIVSTLEKINSSNTFVAPSGYLAFTPSHDLKTGWPHGVGLSCQWKYIDGTKVVIPNPLIYPDSIATGSLRLPYWGINGLLTDPPDPPGDFTINHDAGTPDYDGKFNLNWTDSEGADNYSIYMSDNPITYISKKFDLHAYQTATPPFPISLKQGDYYFRVVAYNKTGETMSSNYVHVTIPGPGPFSLFTNAGEPNTDGTFNLIWTDSERADNYSVYRHFSKITTINESVTLLANQTAQSPFSITGLTNGKYFFAVAAYNEMGLTLSNSVYIIVQLPFDMTVIVIVLISSVVGVTSIIFVKKYLRHKGEKKSEREQQELIIVEGMTREPLERTKTGEKNKLEAKNK